MQRFSGASAAPLCKEGRGAGQRSQRRGAAIAGYCARLPRCRPFSFARQFYDALFAESERETGLGLENIVCRPARLLRWR